MNTLTIPISLGSEPEIIEIDDCSEAVGVEPEQDDGLDHFGDVIELCFASPIGQCVYGIATGYQRCLYCNRGSGAV